MMALLTLTHAEKLTFRGAVKHLGELSVTLISGNVLLF